MQLAVLTAVMWVVLSVDWKAVVMDASLVARMVARWAGYLVVHLAASMVEMTDVALVVLLVVLSAESLADLTASSNQINNLSQKS